MCEVVTILMPLMTQKGQILLESALDSALDSAGIRIRFCARFYWNPH